MRILAVAGALVVSFLAVVPEVRAARVYINGTEVTGLEDTRLENVTVEFDAEGNIRITAPGYRVQVLDENPAPPSPGGASPTLPAPAPSPIYTDSGEVMGYTDDASRNRPWVQQTTTTVSPPAGTGGAGGASGTGTAGAARPAVSPTPPGPPAAHPEAPPRPSGTAAPTLRYFLVSQGSGGAAVNEVIQININGRRVRDVDSTGAQVIVDVTDWVNLGPNTVTLQSTKRPGYVAGPASSFYQVFIGEGHVEPGGQVRLDRPIVTYTRTAADSTAASRSFTLEAR